MALQFAGRYGVEALIDTSTGNLLRAVPVTVYDGGTVTLATLWQDRLKTVPLSNPTATDVLGNLTFYADPGEYDLDPDGPTDLLRVSVPVDPGDVEGQLSEAEADLLYDPLGAAATVNAALGAHLVDVLDAHDATAIVVDDSSFTTVSGDDVEELLASIDAYLAGLGSSGTDLGWVNVVTDHGADLTGAANSLDAFQAGAAQAIAEGRPLYVPPGAYTLTFAATGGNDRIAVTGHLKVITAGKKCTEITVGPETPSFTFYGWRVSPGVRFQMVGGVTMRGPANAGGNSQTNQDTYAFYVDAVPAGQTSEVLLSEVDLTRQFQHGLNKSSGAAGTTGTWFVTLDSCDWTGAGQGLGVFQDVNATDGHLWFRNSKIHGFGNDVQYHHLVYAHSNVNVYVDNLRLADNKYYAFHYFGDSQVSFAQYSTFKSLVIEASCTNGLIASRRSRMTRTHGCTFASAGLQVHCQGSITDLGSTFVTLANSQSVQLPDGDTETSLWSGTTFYVDAAAALGAGGPSDNLFDGAVFVLTNGASIASLQGMDGVRVTWEDCRVYGTAAERFGVGSPNGGYWKMKNCEVFGSFTQGLFGGVGVGGEAFFEDLTLYQTSSRLLALSPGPYGMGGRIRQFRCRHKGSASPAGPFINDPSDYAHGEFYPEIGPNVASATSVNLDINSDTQHVTGTATIVNWMLGSSGGFGNDSGMLLPWHGGRKRLIVDGAWKTSAAGNIMPLTTDPRTVGTVLEFQFDATTQKWYEQGQPNTGGGTGDLLAANNLVDLDDIPTARTNLGLGTSAVRNVGTTAGTVAEGDDARFAAVSGALADWIPATAFVPANTVDLAFLTFANNASHPRPPVYAFADTLAESVSATWHVPEHWATFNIVARWADAAGVGGNAALELWYGFYNAGDNIESGATDTGIVVATGGAGADIAVDTVLASGVANDPTSELALHLHRFGADGSDTLAGTMWLLGVRLVKAS